MSSGTVRALMGGARPNLPKLSLPIFIRWNPTMAAPHHIFLHRNARGEVALDAPWPGTPISGDPHTVTVNGVTLH
jgi:hypothetical protein